MIFLSFSEKDNIFTSYNNNKCKPLLEVDKFITLYFNKYFTHSFEANIFDRHNNITLTFRPIGRLGNRMFEYASLIGIAQKNGLRPVLYPKLGFDRCFKGISAGVKQMSQHETVYQPTNLYFSEEAFHIGHNYTILDSLMQPWKYFGHVDETLRKEYTFYDDMVNISQNYLHDLKRNRNFVTFISVQIRRKDFINQFKHLINGITEDFINRAMHIYYTTFINPIFVVISDDIKWCRNNLNSSIKLYEIYFSENHTACEHLSILASCNHSIITSGSTFGYWGAYLSNGHVLYYPGWLKTDSWYNLKFKERDVFLRRWTAIPRLEHKPTVRRGSNTTNIS